MSDLWPKIQMELAFFRSRRLKPRKPGEKGPNRSRRSVGLRAPAETQELMEQVVERGNLKEALR